MMRFKHYYIGYPIAKSITLRFIKIYLKSKTCNEPGLFRNHRSVSPKTYYYCEIIICFVILIN